MILSKGWEKMNTKTETGSQTIRSFVKKNGAVVIFLLLFLIASFAIPGFFRFSNFMLIIKQAAIPAIACIGMTLVLMTGGIDLSLGYNIGLCSIAVGLMIKSYGVPIWLAVLLTLLLGGFVGLVNGLCVQLLHVPAFITTLGTGYVLLGLAQIISNGVSINRLPEAFLALGKTPVGQLNTTVLIALAVCLLFYYLMHLSTYGRELAAFGLNGNASRLSGLNTGAINLSVYILCGVLASLAGVLLTIDVNCAQPTMGGGNYTFTVITAAVLGGVSLFGGVGGVVGAVFGTLSLKVIHNCINLLNAPYYMVDAIMGIIILLAIIFENVKNRVL